MTNQEERTDFYGQKIKVGNMVTVEEAWEDTSGAYHDEVCTISRILPDGRLKFRFGHWKTRSNREQKIQAWINQFDWYGENIIKD